MKERKIQMNKNKDMGASMEIQGANKIQRKDLKQVANTDLSLTVRRTMMKMKIENILETCSRAVNRSNTYLNKTILLATSTLASMFMSMFASASGVTEVMISATVG